MCGNTRVATLDQGVSHFGDALDFDQEFGKGELPNLHSGECHTCAGKDFPAAGSGGQSRSHVDNKHHFVHDVVHSCAVLRQQRPNVGVTTAHLRFHVADANNDFVLVVTDLAGEVDGVADFDGLGVGKFLLSRHSEIF